MSEDMSNVHAENQTTAVSIFGEAGASGDFPVLKAFQQYIDAEQAKARKRMVWLTAFFVTLLIVIVVVFSVIMSAIISRDQQNLSAIAERNQELSNKLLDIALKNREQPPQPVVQQPQPDTMKPVLEKLESLATAMARPQPQPVQQPQDTMKPVLEKLESIATAMARPQPVQAAQPVVQPPAVVPPPQQPLPTQAELLESLRLQEDMKRLQAELKAEQERQLKAEQERKRQEEVERHRRRLYPEYYAKEDAKKLLAAGTAAPKKIQKGTPAPLPQPSSPVVSPAVALPATQPATKPAAAEQKKPEAKPAKPAAVEQKKSEPKPEKTPVSTRPVKPIDLKSAQPITYFEEDATPSKVNAAEGKPPAEKPAAEKPATPAPEVKKPEEKQGAKKKPEVLNVGTKDGKDLPFLVEPEAK